MSPSLGDIEGKVGGTATSLRAWYKHLPEFGVRFVEDDNLADLFVTHIGSRVDTPPDRPLVARIAGLYWTADYTAPPEEYFTNRYVIESIRQATEVIAPSDWVAQTLRRDMHLNPRVIGHGVDTEEWVPGQNQGYILWNKGRPTDVCNPEPVNVLAKRFPRRLFLTTFAADNPTPNIKATGRVDQQTMMDMVRGAGIYLATTKETFGIGTLEAMSSGLPILGFSHGMTAEIVKHRENGYLAKPGDYDDLAEGLVYCFRHRDRLGLASRELAKEHSWVTVADQISEVFRMATRSFPDPMPDVAVIIPCYNYGDYLVRAVRSVLRQTYSPVQIIIVDNNSTDNTKVIGIELAQNYDSVWYTNCPDQGVAYARNFGIAQAKASYICCLDADDEIAPGFLEKCVGALESDRTAGVAYTKMLLVNQDGTHKLADWPNGYDYDLFLTGRNQVPTCSVFRRDLWERLGGYRQRYAPQGQGSEDAEFYLRMGAIGYKGVLATSEPLFHYHLGGRTQEPGHVHTEYRDKPWILDRKHPLASVATPRLESHPVRQYDQPVVSVVIPLSVSHQKWVVDAIDSLEHQTFRKWEAIVVTDQFLPDPGLVKAYPYVNWIHEPEVTGASACRNEGAAYAKAPLLLFLDADDWLAPNALGEMVGAFQVEQKIIYPDAFLHAKMSKKEAEEYYDQGLLVEHWEKTGETTYVRRAPEYDRSRALKQPDIYGGFYNWNWIVSLVPTLWHNSIGGFDWRMESWEDWDYWIRMARQGYGFYHLPVPLFHYRLATGSRRAIGQDKYDELANYMRKKYDTVGG